MAEYLELEKVLDDRNIITVQTKEYGSIDVIPVDTITDIELSDVQPVRHGRWVYSDIPIFGNPYGRYCCSICGSAMDSGTDNYCPQCGADMGGKNNDNQRM